MLQWHYSPAALWAICWPFPPKFTLGQASRIIAACTTTRTERTFANTEMQWPPGDGGLVYVARGCDLVAFGLQLEGFASRGSPVRSRSTPSYKLGPANR